MKYVSADSDNDGLPDFIEINAYIWAYNNRDEAPTDTSLWINPLVYDAYNDSDSDGLTNIEEWERSGYIMDYEGDDIPNFYDTDDDNDKLPTSVELSADLNPFNRADAHGDKDSDDLDNLWEYENGTMITDADTDHDGINDGAEFKYWQDYLYNEWGGWLNPETGAEVNETAVEYLKNPDVDRDNVTDGKEINGWKVKVITGYDENNNPISKEVTLYGDPLKPYKDKNGAYIDADEDNIPDIVESLLSNNSTFVKFARMFLDPNSEYYNKTIWDNYNWTIAYFYSIALKGSSLSDAEIKFYSILDNITSEPEYYIQFYEDKLRSKGNDKYTENATQWLRDEFNPLITESMPPVITEFTVETVYEGYVGLLPNAWAHIVAEIRDVSGISKVRIKSVCPDVIPAGIPIWRIMTWTKEITYENNPTDVRVDTLIDVTEYSAIHTYNISVNATDSLGNSAGWYKEVDGPIGVVLRTLANWLKGLWDFLCEVGKKIAEGINLIHDYIISLLVSLFNSVKGDIEALKYVISEILYDGSISPLRLIGSILGISSKISLIGGMALMLALPFIASLIISLDDYIYSAMVGIFGKGVHNALSYAWNVYNSASQRSTFNYESDDYYSEKARSDNDEAVKFGIYVALELSRKVSPGLYASGGLGVEIAIYPKGKFAEADIYLYLQTPTAELSPPIPLLGGGRFDMGLTIDFLKTSYAGSYGPYRGSFSMRLLMLGIGIPTNINEHGYLDISFGLECNLPLAIQWSWFLKRGYIPIFFG